MKKKLQIGIMESTRVIPGGGQKVLPQIASHLSKEHNVTIFLQGPREGEQKFENCKVKYIKPKNKYLVSLTFLFLKLKEQFDIIIYGCFPANFAIFRNASYPSIHLTHSPPRVFYGLKKHLLKSSNFIGKLKVIIKNIFFKRLDYLAAQKNTQILAISQEIKKRVMRDYRRDSEIYYPGVDQNKYSPGKYEDYILSVTRMVSAKRPKVIAEAMKYVKDKKIKMIMVGGGDQKEEIKQMSNNLPNLEVRGFVSDEELQKLYSNCLAAIYIPINEDYGYTPVEAGMCEKSTIGVNEGGLRETIVDGKTGFLIDDVTPKKVAEKIDVLAKDKKLAETMGKAARKHCEKFELEKTFKVIDETIKEVMKN